MYACWFLLCFWIFSFCYFFCYLFCLFDFYKWFYMYVFSLWFICRFSDLHTILNFIIRTWCSYAMLRKLNPHSYMVLGGNIKLFICDGRWCRNEGSEQNCPLKTSLLANRTITNGLVKLLSYIYLLSNHCAN